MRRVAFRKQTHTHTAEISLENLCFLREAPAFCLQFSLIRSDCTGQRKVKGEAGDVRHESWGSLQMRWGGNVSKPYSCLTEASTGRQAFCCLVVSQINMWMVSGSCCMVFKRSQLFPSLSLETFSIPLVFGKAYWYMKDGFMSPITSNYRAAAVAHLLFVFIIKEWWLFTCKLR